MILLANDYSEGACEAVLRHLVETNAETLPGYGEDLYCDRARDKIRRACQTPEAEVFFISGGTQANVIVLKALLGPCEGVIAPDTGHISVHEAGTVEAGGHKVLTLPNCEGKISAADVKRYVEDFYEDRNHSQMVYPAAVYISYPTEYGTLYSRKELEALSDVCREKGLFLYLDGARLGYGLAAKQADVTLSDIARFCDLFYIGGTKTGALCGEAVVFYKGNAPKHFTTFIRQQGGLLAKGRLLGVQFDALFTGDTYVAVCRQAIETADALKRAFTEKGYALLMDSPTNQIFVILDNDKYERLKKDVVCRYWRKLDENRTVVRFVTSWATSMESIDRIRALL